VGGGEMFLPKCPPWARENQPIQAPFFSVTWITFYALNPAYARTIKRYAGRFAGVTARILL
jgi:hypothetical protein